MAAGVTAPARTCASVLGSITGALLSGTASLTIGLGSRRLLVLDIFCAREKGPWTAVKRDQWTNVMTSPGDDGERESEGLKC